MFEIIFTKKYKTNNEHVVGNVLYNLQFFIENAINNNNEKDNFINLFQSYIVFLESQNFNLIKLDFLKNFEKYGVVFKHRNINLVKFSPDECSKSNKILIYTGFSNINWNYTYSLNNALGGSRYPSSSSIYCLTST
jgi:hypothetical protein